MSTPNSINWQWTNNKAALYTVSSVTQRRYAAEMETNRLPALIEARIAQLGISQRAYAERLGVSSSHINSLIKGKITLPRPDVRRRIAKDLGLSHLDLLVTTGELLPEEIPQAGEPRDPFSPNDPRGEVLSALIEVDPYQEPNAIRLEAVLSILDLMRSREDRTR
jgi:transcriptional regulator with XRE-family HTH domain